MAPMALVARLRLGSDPGTAPTLSGVSRARVVVRALVGHAPRVILNWGRGA